MNNYTIHYMLKGHCLTAKVEGKDGKEAIKNLAGQLGIPVSMLRVHSVIQR